MADDPTPLWEFHHFLDDLKELPRTGWVQRGIPHPESVAAHSFAVAVLAALAARSRGLEPGRAALLALVHDLPEALIGDRIPGELPPAEKRRLETQAIGQQDATARTAGWLAALWHEYETGSSAEARLVRALDLADAVLQGAHYRQTRPPPGAAGTLDDLIDNCLGRIADPVLRDTLAARIAPPEPPANP